MWGIYNLMKRTVETHCSALYRHTHRAHPQAQQANTQLIWMCRRLTNMKNKTTWLHNCHMWIYKCREHAISSAQQRTQSPIPPTKMWSSDENVDNIAFPAQFTAILNLMSLTLTTRTHSAIYQTKVISMINSNAVALPCRRHYMECVYLFVK